MSLEILERPTTLEEVEHPTSLSIVAAGSSTTVEVATTGTLRITTPATVMMVETAMVGLQGPKGDPMDAVEVVATEDLAAYAAVTATGALANSSNLAHFGRVIGITSNAISSGFSGLLRDSGEVTNTSWSWTAGMKLFLNGSALSSTPPTTGFSQLIAIARNSHTVFVQLEPPILL